MKSKRCCECLNSNVKTTGGNEDDCYFMFGQPERIQYGFSNQTVLPDFLAQAGPGDICFIEGNDVLPFWEKVEKLILYCWNRIYPADLYFDPAVLEGWRLTEKKDFPGFSHEILTRKVYER